MGQNSRIEWTDHTYNPWWGCMNVSEGCRNCYALDLAERYGHHVWGPALLDGHEYRAFPRLPGVVHAQA